MYKLNLHASEGPYECDSEAIALTPSSLECEVVHEICEFKPVCQTEERALVCRHQFSCSGDNASPIRSSFKPSEGGQKGKKRKQFLKIFHAANLVR